MLAHAIKSAQATDPDHIVVVAGHGAEAVRNATAEYAPEAQVVLQEEQLGTGHAVAGQSGAGDYDGDILVLYGDTPFISDQPLPTSPHPAPMRIWLFWVFMRRIRAAMADWLQMAMRWKRSLNIRMQAQKNAP